MADLGRLGDAFDRQAEVAVSEHLRPHWFQAGAVVFITFRLADSIPRQVIERWEREKLDWLRRHGWSGFQHWSEVLPRLAPELRQQFIKQFNRCREDFLDTCHGECVLRDPNLARIVADTLMHFDGQRYRMGDFIVMPNHVHLLAAFAPGSNLVAQCDSWLHYSARQINLALGRKGKLWQPEPFDHLVRSGEQYTYLRSYIRDNATKARLKEYEFLYRRYEG